MYDVKLEFGKGHCLLSLSLVIFSPLVTPFFVTFKFEECITPLENTVWLNLNKASLIKPLEIYSEQAIVIIIIILKVQLYYKLMHDMFKYE